MKTKTTYICEKCGSEYLSARAAQLCEAYVLDSPSAAPGHKILVKQRYGDPVWDEVLATEVAPGLFSSVVNSWIENDGETGLDLCLQRFESAPQFHHWVYVTKSYHQIGKDTFTDRIPLSCVADFKGKS